MHVIKIKILFDYFTLYLFKNFGILNYDNHLKNIKINLFTFEIN